MAAPHPKARILVADDEPDLLIVMKDTLESEGFAVETADDGKAALEAIRRDPPDLAIIDLMMPELDGFEVCKALRADPVLEFLPLIILTASSENDNKIQGLNLGADDFITKPVDIAELLARVRMIMRRSQQGLDANPLTHLPGNVTIEKKIDEALDNARPLAVLYIDLNQFKAYNDAYGYDAGDHVIKGMAQVLLKSVRTKGDFAGHIGGDDFIVLTTPDRMEDVAQRVIDDFSAIVPSFYKEEDRRVGKVRAKDRQGVLREYPLLSVAIGICHNSLRPLTSYAQISQFGAELKKYAKEKPGSAYVIDRRKD
jgi:diguanylate cyclase (GGDEF)-like protein